MTQRSAPVVTHRGYRGLAYLLARIVSANALISAKAVVLMCLGSVVTFAQTVTLTNTTRGGSSVFYVGDAWEFDIHGAANAAR